MLYFYAISVFAVVRRVPGIRDSGALVISSRSRLCWSHVVFRSRNPFFSLSVERIVTGPYVVLLRIIII